MRYLSILAVLFMVGCASTCGTNSSMGGGDYNDYTYKAADGSMKTHRVYKNGNEEWINPAVVSETAAK